MSPQGHAAFGSTLSSSRPRKVTPNDFFHASMRGGPMTEPLPQRGPNGYTAMHFACEYGHLHVVNLLLQAQATPADLSDVQGWTPLQRAAIDGHTAVVAALLNINVDKRTGKTLYPIMSRDKAGDTALHEAARYGQLECARLLVGAGADAAKRNKQGKTALEVARTMGKAEVATFLESAPQSAAEELSMLRRQQKQAEQQEEQMRQR